MKPTHSEMPLEQFEKYRKNVMKYQVDVMDGMDRDILESISDDIARFVKKYPKLRFHQLFMAVDLLDTYYCNDDTVHFKPHMADTRPVSPEPFQSPIESINILDELSTIKREDTPDFILTL